MPPHKYRTHVVRRPSGPRPVRWLGLLFVLAGLSIYGFRQGSEVPSEITSRSGAKSQRVAASAGQRGRLQDTWSEAKPREKGPHVIEEQRRQFLAPLFEAARAKSEYVPVEQPGYRGPRAADASVPSPDLGATTRAVVPDRTADEDIQEVRLRWADEQVDPGWTDETRGHVETMLGDLEIAGEVGGVSCRASLCRIRLDLADMDEALKLREGAGGHAEGRWIELSPQEEGAFSVNVFVEREGGA